MNNLYPCSFKCLKSVAVMVCVWLPPFLFSGYSFTLAYCYKQLVFLRFLWLIFLFLSTVFFLAPHFQYIQLKRRTFYCVRVFGIFFNFSIVVLSTKLNRRLLKTMASFLNFVFKTALIRLVLGGFFYVFSQSETICNFHSCYKFALMLQKNCSPFSANQN